MASDLESRLAAIIDYHVKHGVLPPDAGADSSEDAAALRAMVQRYLALTHALDDGSPPDREGAAAPAATPVIDGFRTIERLGAGGMGEVYKLEDLQLGRIVAGKVLRQGSAGLGSRVGDFLREAQALALFSDPRIVQIFEARADADPPVIIMEFVDGFELGRLGPSLEFHQRARIVRDVCDALARAHDLGLQHRDLKPSNIMLDGQLTPKILDFGLSGHDPRAGHLRGTLSYLAPEQLDPRESIDARTDVYALGVTLYELLTGVVPYGGDTDQGIIDAIRAGRPALPIEIDPAVPEPLQAIALKAMERRPADRYASAREMALDLDRALDGRPVLARPTQYATTLEAKAKPHLDEIDDWQRLKLVYPHEAARLRAAYRGLDAREDDWIAASRSLSYSQIALYLGAFLLLMGSLYYFAVHRFYGAVTGVVQPLLVLGAPFIGLNVAGRWLYGRAHQAVAIAFYVAGVSLLPIFLLIWLPEAHLLMAPAGSTVQLFGADVISNRQLQVTILIACAWAGWLALRTRTAALSAVTTLLALLLALAILADFGLRAWIEDGRYDRLALHLWPIVPVYALTGYWFERTKRAWLARPLYVGAGVTLLAVLDLLALDGRMFEYLGISLRTLQAQASDPTLLDTLTALAVNGVFFYVVASAAERAGTSLMAPAANLLFVVAPFSMLEPLAYLSERAEYSPRFDWLYAAMAVTVAILSHQRQRRSFYYAGLLNTGFALFLIARRRHWFDQPSWAIALVVVGLAALAAGFLLDAWNRRRTGAIKR